MKFSAVVLALATSVAAWHDNVTYVTDVVTAVTTFCPYATTLVHNGHTYTVTEATTLTITNCPCTITRPVTVSYSNSTAPPHTATTPATIPAASSPSASYKPSPTSSTVTAGAGKVATLSGAGLAVVLGFAALL